MAIDGRLAKDLWVQYGEHAERIFAQGPKASIAIGDRSFFVASGANHVDLNQAAMYGAATTADAAEIARLVVEAECPVLLGRSSTVPVEVMEPLETAGFRAMPVTEHIFWMPGVPTEQASSFKVRRMNGDADIVAMQAMFLEVHGYEPELTATLYGDAIRADEGVTGWIAWDGDEAVSLAFVTTVGTSLGLWDVMTPLRHRRRGAARALVATALRAVATASALPIARTLFWSSPAGRPLYDALGFRVGDTVQAWTLGASEADLAAVGAG
jgi:GNAT superfamily N-acetyltransferase